MGPFVTLLNGYIPPLKQELEGIQSQLPTGWQAYVPWDVDLIYEGINKLRDTIGTGFNIGFWIFLIISGIYLILKLVDGIGH